MMSPESLAAYVTTVAITIAEGKSEKELTMLAAILMQISDVLASIVAARELNTDKN